MKNMNDKTKKWLVVAGGLAVSAVLVVMISNQFKVPSTEDITIPAQSSEVQDIVVDSPDITEKEDDITVPPIEIPNQTESKNGAVDTGTEQTIQLDIPEKPTYTEEKLTNSNQKPNGEKADPPTEENPTQNKPQQPSNNDNQPQGGDVNSKGETYLPGFGWIENSGENHGTIAEDMYENGNKIGIMD